MQRKGQMTLGNLMQVIIVTAIYLLAGLPVISAIVAASGLTGLNGLIAEFIPLAILLGILKMIWDTSTPTRQEYYPG